MTVGAARTPLSLIIELLWSFAAAALFVAVFGQGDGPPPSFAAVAAAVLGSFALARLLQFSDLDERAMRIAGVAASAGALFVLARIEYAPQTWLWDLGWLARLLTDPGDAIQPNAHVIAGVIVLVSIWLRGVMRGQAAPEFDGVLGSASLGLLVVIVAALAAPDTREAVSWGAFAFAYAAIAFVSLAVSRAPEPDAPAVRFARRWTVALAAIFGAAIGVAVIAAAIDPRAFGVLAPIGEPAVFAGRLLAIYVLGPIIWLLALPIQLFGWVLERLLPDHTPSQRPPEIAPPPREPPKKSEQPLWFQIIVWVFGAGTAVLGVAIVATLLWFAFRRFARRAEDDPRERRDEIEPASSLRDDLGELLVAFARRFGRRSRPQSAVAIRRLYFEMLDAAAAVGIERPRAATPLRFAPSLDAHFGSDAPTAITRAFAASRYGELPIDAAALRDLRSRWGAVVRGT